MLSLTSEKGNVQILSIEQHMYLSDFISACIFQHEPQSEGRSGSDQKVTSAGC